MATQLVSLICHCAPFYPLKKATPLSRCVSGIQGSKWDQLAKSEFKWLCLEPVYPESVGHSQLLPISPSQAKTQDTTAELERGKGTSQQD